jgi:PAS domain S-box-containing protein
MGTENHSALFTAALSCVADGVFTVDEHFRITSFNRAAERITGVAADKALGKRCSDVLRADICENGCAVRRMLETGREVVGRPARILGTKSRPTPVSVSAAVLREKDGKLHEAVETFRDLSALEQLRREIQDRDVFEDIVGKSAAFQKVFAILPDSPQPANQPPARAVARRAASPLGRAEADAIRDVLLATGGHLGRAAKELGISRTTLWRKMKKHGIRVGGAPGE